jgi:tRNA pseudouridine65 synthase
LQTSVSLLYTDAHIAVVRKPPDIHVHRTALSTDETSVLQIVKQMLGCMVYPAHRLDRPSSGIMVLGLTPESGTFLQQAFEHRQVQKTYLLVVRGHTPEHGIFTFPLSRPDSAPQEAETRFALLQHAVVPVAIGAYPEAWLSLVRAFPATGRRHQLRRHFAKAAFPIIGDTKYGNSAYNTYFREQAGFNRLALFAESLSFQHPVTHEYMKFIAPPDEELKNFWQISGFQISLC